MEGRGRRCREPSPERFKVCAKPTRALKPTFRKVQVVYYLSRNGHLEHPHFMEVTHLAHQQLRLKDVMDRLTVLRGKGMPSLYSWSCKRSYKNGYVWNDLAESDVIYPSEGPEYVLKGSELIEGCTEKIQQLQLSDSLQVVSGPTFHLKRKPLATKRHSEDDEEEEDMTSFTSSMTPKYSNCSRGVSTDGTELTVDHNSPPLSTTSSDKPNESNNTSMRIEDGDPVADEPTASRGNSVLLQLVSCGGSTSFRGRSVQPPWTAARKSGASLHKGVLCKTAAAAAEEDEVVMIGCMSENPRFGNLQGEEREYFSGSIAEGVGEERVQVGPRLKRSSSFNEERSSKTELIETVEVEPKREKAGAMTGKCIPRMKCSKQPTK